MEKSDSLRDEFHSLNNWLNKITALSGVTRYKLETKGLNMDSIEDEIARLIKLLNDMEECAMKVSEIVKHVRKTIEN